MKENTPVSISDATQYDIPGGRCYLYPDSPTGRLSCAFVEQNGRYPAKGFRENLVCTEAFFVIEGEMRVTIKGHVFVMKPQDVIYIPPLTPYAVEGVGKTFVFIEPQWSGAQNVATG